MNSQRLTKLHTNQIKKVPELRPGDTVRVHQKIKEGNKERIQVFEGVVLRVKGGGLNQTFLVRKVSFGIGVEKNYLIHSPNIAKIEVKKRAKVRQAYLGYLRNLTGKSARLKDKQFDMLAVNIKEEPITEAPVPASTEEIAEQEEKQATKEDKSGSDKPDDGGQAAEKAEIEEGVKEAEKDTQAKEGKKAEKVKEEVKAEEIAEEAKEEN